MASQDECVKAESVGFKIMEARDMALDETFGGDPWWLLFTLAGTLFTFRFQLTGVGKWITRNLLWALEGIWLVPPGTYQVQEMLQQVDGLRYRWIHRHVHTHVAHGGPQPAK